MKVSKFPIVFGSDSCDLGGFYEQIAPEAVDRTLRGTADVICLFNHNHDMPLGRRATNTLTLDKMTDGLRATVDINEDVSFAADFLALMRRNDAPGGSFAFRCVDDIWSLKDGVPHRLVIDAVIRECSLAVSFPAYAATAAALRSNHAAAQTSMTFRRALLKQLRVS